MREPRFRFREDKAAEAAVEIIRLQGGHSDMIRVMKLLYLADRESLEKRSIPITGDRYVSMDQGPVLSMVYDLLKDTAIDSVWHSRVHREGNILSVAGGAPLGALSDEDRQIIRVVVERHASKDTWALCDWTHRLPEWKNPHGSSIPIEVSQVLSAVGRTIGEIEEIAQEEDGWYNLHRAIGVE